MLLYLSFPVPGFEWTMIQWDTKSLGYQAMRNRGSWWRKKFLSKHLQDPQHLQENPKAHILSFCVLLHQGLKWTLWKLTYVFQNVFFSLLFTTQAIVEQCRKFIHLTGSLSCRIGHPIQEFQLFTWLKLPKTSQNLVLFYM